MKLQFDPSQQYQLDAISAIVDIFKGQPLSRGSFEMEVLKPERQVLFGSYLDSAFGNNYQFKTNTILQMESGKID